MAMIQVELRIRTAWWVHWYLGSVQLFSHLTGMEPDIDRVVATAMRGVRVESRVGAEGRWARVLDRSAGVRPR